MKPDREREPAVAAAPPDDTEADFAEEHRDLTVGDLERGGPEDTPEPESPEGYGGGDFRRSRGQQGHGVGQ